MGGSSKKKEPEPVPVAASPAVQAAAQQAKVRERGAVGKAATVLTPFRKRSVEQVQIGTKKLLGQ